MSRRACATTRSARRRARRPSDAGGRGAGRLSAARVALAAVAVLAAAGCAGGGPEGGSGGSGGDGGADAVPGAAAAGAERPAEDPAGGRVGVEDTSGAAPVQRVALRSFLTRPVPLHDEAGGSIRLPSAAAGIRALLGEPERLVREPVRNRHQPERTDTILTLVYPELEARIYRVSADGKELLIAVYLTGDRYWPAPGVRVGARRDALERALGAPARVEHGNELVYPCDDCSAQGYESLRVHMVGPTVAQIELSFPAD